MYSNAAAWSGPRNVEREREREREKGRGEARGRKKEMKKRTWELISKEASVSVEIRSRGAPRSRGASIFINTAVLKIDRPNFVRPA